MAKCKYCGESISRLDKDVCPFCGGNKPLDGIDDSTQDITKAIEQIDVNTMQRSKVIAAVMAFLLGIFGLHNFYLGKNKIGLVTFGISAITIGGIGSILFFTVLNNVFAYLIPYFFLEALMIGVGISILARHDIKDERGEFLR